MADLVDLIRPDGSLETLGPYLVPDDLATVLNLSVEFVRRQLRAKLLPGIQVGQEWRTSRRDFDAYLRGEWTPQAEVMAVKNHMAPHRPRRRKDPAAKPKITKATGIHHDPDK